MVGDRSTASKWVMGFLIYFLVYFIIMYTVTGANRELGISSSTIAPNSNFAASYTIDSCDRPRCEPDNLGCTTDADDASLSCSLINDNEVCTVTDGCHWIAQSYLGIDAHCEGTVNYSVFWNGGAPSDVGTSTTVSSLFTKQLLYNKSNDATISLSSTPLLNSDAKQCRGFGFTWYTAGSTSYNQLNPNLDVSTFTYTIMAIFGFQGDTGLPSDYKWIFTLLFTYIPLIAFGLIVLMMLPV